MKFPNMLSNLLKTASVAFGLLFFIIISEVSAQSDFERSEKEQIKPVDYHFSTSAEKRDLLTYPTQKTTSKPITPSEPVLRDNSGYRVDDKREVVEEGKSTLSFNIFLYVLDRYKEK